MKKRLFVGLVVGLLLFQNLGLLSQAAKIVEVPAEQVEGVYNQAVDSNRMKEWPNGPHIYSESGIVMDVDTGSILYGKNIDDKHYPASITKVLTALVALENCDLDSKVKHSWEDVNNLESGATHIGIKKDEVIIMNDNIIIKGVEKLKDLSYNIIPDRIEAGTLLCSAAITGGNIKLQKVIPEHIKTLLNKLEEMGCNIKIGKNEVALTAPKKLKSVDIKTLPYPGFPTDLQSIVGVTLTVAKGTSVIVENIFENRYKYLSELTKMGAKSTIEGRTAVIKGVRKLNKANVRATDLRGGAAMVIAGLNAKGRTCIDNIEYILRGYEKLDVKLKSLGADIYIEELEDKN